MTTTMTSLMTSNQSTVASQTSQFDRQYPTLNVSIAAAITVVAFTRSIIHFVGCFLAYTPSSTTATAADSNAC